MSRATASFAALLHPINSFAVAAAAAEIPLVLPSTYESMSSLIASLRGKDGGQWQQREVRAANHPPSHRAEDEWETNVYTGLSLASHCFPMNDSSTNTWI